MDSGREVVVLSGVRTAIGDYGGALKDIAPTELAAKVIREAVARAKVAPEDVGHVVFGNVIHTEPKDMYLSRVATLNGGLPKETPALTLNRLCGSGLQAIVSAAQLIKLGDADVALAGGAESMSRGGYLNPALRWGARMGDNSSIDMMVGALTDPFDTVHMGITAENVAAKWEITRQQQDELALESNRRAVKAAQSGHFKDQILPIEIKTRKGVTVVDTDEHPRADASLESLAKLKTVFKPDGSVTAGNASGINDGAAAVVLMERKAAEKKGVKPLARLVAYAHGHRAGPCSQESHGARRIEGRRHGCDRIQRGLRRPGVRGCQGARIRWQEAEPERRRDRSGPSDRSHGRHSDCEGDLRATPHRRPLCAGHDVHRRRPGHRGDLREAVVFPIPRTGDSRGVARFLFAAFIRPS